jgi:beta-N-acetylhexosaminidase
MDLVTRFKVFPLLYKTHKTSFVTKKSTFFWNKPFFTASKLLFLLFMGLFSLNACAQGDKNQAPVSMDEKIGQMIKVGFRGMDANNQSTIAKQINSIHLGGVVLFDYDVPADTAFRNIQSPEQLRSLSSQLQSYSDTPLIIAIDQEGGKVNRLKEKFGFPSSVSAQYLGELDNMDSTRHYARLTARTLRKEGINVNLAPVVDLNTNPDNPVIGGLERSFSADPEAVTRHAQAFIEEMHTQGILTTLKHFPGHGNSEKDSHKGVVDVTKTWEKKELIPYRNLIESGHADIIMTAHIYNARLDSSYPATLSKPVITGILRDSLGFNGVVMSDDLQMGAIRKQYGLEETIRLSIQAGVDILSFANNSVFDPQIGQKAHRIIKALIDEGTITEARIDSSYARIMKLKDRLGVLSSRIISTAPICQAKLVPAKS